MIGVVYHRGGEIADHPSRNRAEQWDGDARVYTRWDESGKVIEERPFTDDEQAAADENRREAAAVVNRGSVDGRMRSALRGNRDYLDLPVYPASPTAAQRDAAIRAIRQQVDALTRQANALIKLELSDLEDTTGT